MTLTKGVMAAAMVGLSVSAAAACDDYAEEMAMIAAKRAVAEARMAAEPGQATPAQAVQTASPADGAVTAGQTQTVVSAADAMRK